MGFLMPKAPAMPAIPEPKPLPEPPSYEDQEREEEAPSQHYELEDSGEYRQLS